jgi:hypothetical protein
MSNPPLNEYERTVQILLETRNFINICKSFSDTKRELLVFYGEIPLPCSAVKNLPVAVDQTPLKIWFFGPESQDSGRRAPREKEE